MSVRLHLGPERAAVLRRLRAWRAADVAARLVARDAALWTDAGIADTPGDPIAERLGWIDLPATSPDALPAWRALADGVRADGVRHIVLLGMGGSSLGAEVLARSLPRAAGAPELIVCDSTHPAFVRAVDAVVDPSRALVVAASKSGTTVETTAHLAHWWARLESAVGDPGRRCVAITDAGSPLADAAAQRGFRACVLAPADVGGRFSVLGPFGLLPAVLAGVDVAPVLAGAATARAALIDAARGGGIATGAATERDPAATPAEQASGLALGAALGEWAAAGRDTLLIDARPPYEAVTGWLEQLLGESLGKRGRGVFPARPWGGMPAGHPDRVAVIIDGSVGVDTFDARADADADSDVDRATIRTSIGSAADLGAALFAWEVATATAALALGVQPFDQPDVEAAKRFAREAVAERRAGARASGDGAVDRTAAANGAGGVASTGATTEPEVLRAADIGDVARAARIWLADTPADAAVAVQAYLPPSAAGDAALDLFAQSIVAATGAAVAWGYGPRYLHSTGQLHKGGPAWVRCLQLVDGSPGDDVAIPDSLLTFGRLIDAQAAGDAAALRALGRPPLVVRVGGS